MRFWNINDGNKTVEVPLISGSSDDYLGSSISVGFNTSKPFSTDSGKSTDILFTQIALGEGPLYRINPNGPQDIEIDDKYIDDLIDFNTNMPKKDMFACAYSTGTITPSPMSSFFDEIVTPITFSSPITLKSGISLDSQKPAPPEVAVQLMPLLTEQTVDSIDAYRFKFNISKLQSSGPAGAQPAQLSLIALVHPITQMDDFTQYIAGSGLIINSLVEGSMSAEIEVKIPNNKKNSSGYKVSVMKVTEDIAEEGFVAEVTFTGIDEIRTLNQSFPRTAIAGYVIKSSDYRTGAVPQYTSLVKGLIVKVPSNYNQPVLDSGEIDWRQIETPREGLLSIENTGYKLQNDYDTVKTDPQIPIYLGIWDGKFKYDWTENGVWIVYHLLTDPIQGLGFPESSIDKFNFYQTAQYNDAVDPLTGMFKGVLGFSDGTFRYKPRDFMTDHKDILLGLPEGTRVQERRFVTGITIADKTKVLDVIQSIAASMRTTLSMVGNRFAFIADKDNLLPQAMFNESNIEDGSMSISGIREEDIINGVEVTYTNFGNHFKKESMVLDIPNAFSEKENRASLEATGCSRSSQALRFANYTLLSSRYSKRKLQFSTHSTASDLSVGSIISVSQKQVIDYGFGGIVYEDSVANTDLSLEYITVPELTEEVLTSNTYPLVLKIFSQETNNLDYYIIDNNNYSFTSSDMSVRGNNIIGLSAVSQLNKSTKVFEPISVFSRPPQREDLWALGEVNPNDVYRTTSDKLFRIDTISFDTDNKVSISATEYNPALLRDVDNSAGLISSVNAKNQSFLTPPIPIISLASIPSKTNEGVISYNVLISTGTNTQGYTIPVSTLVEYGEIDDIYEVTGQTEL